MSCRSRADDDLSRKVIGIQARWWIGWGNLTTRECIFVLLSFLSAMGAISTFKVYQMPVLACSRWQRCPCYRASIVGILSVFSF